jgi:hypothetical protein
MATLWAWGVPITGYWRKEGKVNCADCGKDVAGQTFITWRDNTYCEECGAPLSNDYVVLKDGEPLLWTNDYRLAIRELIKHADATGLFYKRYEGRVWALWDRNLQVKHHLSIKEVRLVRLSNNRFASAIALAPDHWRINGSDFYPCEVQIVNATLVWGNGEQKAVEVE